jgi:hypothetical protein
LRILLIISSGLPFTAAVAIDDSKIVNTAVANPDAVRMSAWLNFFGIVVAWIVTVLGSFWGRAKARGRARQLGLAA